MHQYIQTTTYRLTYTDASDYQVGAAIIQNGLPVAYFSKKLFKSQLFYSVTEKELLAIVLCLKEYRKILYGGVINVYTDHKNLTFKTLSVQRILCWRIFMDKFDLTLKYIKGKNNVLADCFSRLPLMSPPTDEKGNLTVTQKRNRSGTIIDFNNLNATRNDDMILEEETFFNNISDIEQHSNIEDDNELIDCFLNLPTLDGSPNPISLQNIWNHQHQDNGLMKLVQAAPSKFPVKIISNVPLITVPGKHPDDWKILIPPTLINDTLRWYHETLGHCGSQKLYDTISSRFYSPNLSSLCKDYRCNINCKKYKQLQQQYGHLPPRNALVVPWDKVAVDLIGPWKIKVNSQLFTFNALMCINPVTNLVEITRIQNKTSRHVAQQFENCWLS